jgi:alpha/beta superfamily hydrolase
MHYLSHLHPNPAPDTSFMPDPSPVSPQSHPQASSNKGNVDEPPLVILGGYSYGSLILKHLPPVPSILQPFATPLDGSAASEIVLRALKLADQSNLEWINLAKDAERQKRHGHENKLSVTMGGEETSPEKRRTSREIRRSIDGRRSLDLGERLRSLSHSHKRRKGSAPNTPPDNGSMKVSIEVPEVKYLLISPLTPPISTLAAPGIGHGFWNRSPEHHEVIGKHTTLAVYGDQDIFSSSKKLRQWAEKLSSEQKSAFTYVEIAGAGHFWHENGVEEKLRSALKEWGADAQS